MILIDFDAILFVTKPDFDRFLAHLDPFFRSFRPKTRKPVFSRDFRFLGRFFDETWGFGQKTQILVGNPNTKSSWRAKIGGGPPLGGYPPPIGGVPPPIGAL